MVMHGTLLFLLVDFDEDATHMFCFVDGLL